MSGLAWWWADDTGLDDWGPDFFPESTEGLSRPDAGPQFTPGSSVVTVGSLTAQQQLSQSANRPLIMASHAVRSASTDAAFRAWWSQTASFNSGSNQVDPTNGPAYNLYDDLFNDFSFPLVSATHWYLMFDFGASVQAFDCALILGHNFGTIGGLTVVLKVADDPAFSSNLRTAATWNPASSNKRLVSVGLGGGTDTYSNVRYALLDISGSTAFVPSVGEVVLSSRIQMNRSGLLPLNPDTEARREVDFDSRNGVTTRYNFYTRRHTIDGTIREENSTDAALVSSWWSQTDGGLHPFGWIEQPALAPNSAYWMLASGGFENPYQTDQVRDWKYSAVEQGSPFMQKET